VLTKCYASGLYCNDIAVTEHPVRPLYHMLIWCINIEAERRCPGLTKQKKLAAILWMPMSTNHQTVLPLSIFVHLIHHPPPVQTSCMDIPYVGSHVCSFTWYYDCYLISYAGKYVKVCIHHSVLCTGYYTLCWAVLRFPFELKLHFSLLLCTLIVGFKQQAASWMEYLATNRSVDWLIDKSVLNVWTF